MVDVEKAYQKSIFALRQMCREMYRKNIEIGRVAKVASTLLMAGMAPVSIPDAIVCRVLAQQKADGGWAGVQDTAWCTKLLSFFNVDDEVNKALSWLQKQQVEGNGWGRSGRDMGRIPVTGSLLYLFPQLGAGANLQWLEQKWLREQGSLTYKAAYTLMAFNSCNYKAAKIDLIQETVKWLQSQQEKDGGFAPWCGHPVGSNVLCTALSVIGLMSYPIYVPGHEPIRNAIAYILRTQLPGGLWPFHQLDDGAVWGLLALKKYYLYVESL